jgi:non-ribosomal peptide synthetase-like protein
VDAPPSAPPSAPPTAASTAAASSAAGAPGGPSGTPHYALCAALQLLFFLVYSFGAALVLAGGAEWIAGGSGLLETYVRAVLFGAAVFLGVCVLPILGKWVLVGRWRPREIRLWSLAYVRFWCAKTLIRANPLALFAGSPVYSLYLRALGARIGRGVTVFTRHVPVCTDLLTVGDGTVIR